MQDFLELAARQLWQLTVVWPAWLLTPEGLRALSSPRRARGLVLFAVTVGLVVALAQVMPFAASLVYAGDLVTYLDLAAVAWVLSASGQIRHAIRAARATRPFRRSPPRPPRTGRRSPRTAAPRRASPPANDDEPGRRVAA